MVAASTSGATSLQDFLEADGMEYQAWSDYAMGGPSEVRTQLLLAQLIQMVSSALGGKSLSIDKLLPYYSELTGANTAKGKREKKRQHIARHQSMVDEIIAKRIKGDG